MNKKQEELYKILLLPIMEQKIDSYKIEENVIYSGTKYGTKFDPDMSNIAIKFYSIIYELEEEVLLSESEKSVKGDTMNASSTYYKPPSEELTEQWNVDKHCLANFWILPMNIGRTPVRHLSEEQKLYCKHSRKSRIHDYMDVFLEFLSVSKNLDYYFCEYKEYFDAIKVSRENFVNEFSQAHFLKKGYYEINSVKKIDKTTLRNGYDSWRKAIEERAQEIATSNKWEKLYDEIVIKHRQG